MATGISNKQPGGIDETFRWLLHTSGNAIATGARVGNGNGDDTALELYSDRIGIHGATNEVTIAFNGANDRAVTLPDASGEIMLKETALSQLDITRVLLGADVDNATTSYAGVGGLEFTPAASSTYSIRMMLLVSSSVVNGGVNLRLDGPTSETEAVSYIMSYPSSLDLVTSYTRCVFGTGHEPGNTMCATTDHTNPAIITVDMILKTTSTAPASPLQVAMAAFGGSQTVRIHAGSHMEITKI